MTPERWQQVDRILDQVLEHDSDRWPVLLDAACDGDEQLRREVSTLLQRCTQAGRTLKGPLPLMAELLGSRADETVEEGQHIGPYRLVRVLGHGGMGTVYLAERADGAFEKEVALKVVKRGMGTNRVLRRFLSERQILAQLEHPSIARLLDGGVTAGGRPYFAMEHVVGEPITAYCDGRRLPVKERLKLFLKVGEAVAYAHQNLIVHRDLKPSNVLVTSEGHPKLLDFGIAKLLDPEQPGAASLTQTGQARAPMTPAYAAPEQVRGAPVTTATDVYALGALLYELLTGRRPYGLQGLSASEVEQTICKTLPERPSRAVLQAPQDGMAEEDTPEALCERRRTHPRTLCRELRGDLDAVVLMALRKDPKRRYASAAELRSDLDRYLENRPVTAQPDSAWYRIAKFLRRHRVGGTVAAVFVLMLLAYAVTVTVQAKRVRGALAEAQVRTRQVEEASALMVDLFPIANPQEVKGELLQQRVKRLKQELDDQPEVWAQMLSLAGRIYQALGLYDQAQPLLETSLETRRQFFTPPHPDLASSTSDLATLLTHQGRYDQADSLFRDAISQWKKLQASGSEASRQRIEMEKAESLNDRGHLLWSRGRQEHYEEAHTLFQEALALKQKWKKTPHPEVATTLNNLGLLLKKQNKLKAAEIPLRKALQMRKALGEELDVANSLNNLASLMRDQANYVAAQSLHREALAIRERLLGNAHPAVANSLNNLGVVLRDEGEYAAAAPLLRRALRIRQERLGAEHPHVANTAYNLGLSLHKMDNYEAADSLYRQALAIDRKNYGEEHYYVGIDLRGLGALLRDRGLPDEAKRQLERALAIFQKAWPEGHWRTARAQGDLGACLTALGRYEEAELHLHESFATLKKDRGLQDPSTKQTMTHLAALYEAWGKQDLVERYRALLDET